MIKYIDLARSQTIVLPFLREISYQERFNKGWSLSFAYYFSEIRDVYLAIKFRGYTNQKQFADECIDDLHLPYSQTPWDRDGRRLLEQKNALQNFGLLDKNNQIIDKNIFLNSIIGTPINDEERNVFKNIFFSYFRFKEIMSWFIDPEINDREELIESVCENKVIVESKTIFSFSQNSRFTDSFIFELNDNAIIYYIPKEQKDNNEDLMRFWDVFVKWGLELSIIEKFNLKNLDYQFANNYRSLACIYFKKAIFDNFDLVHYILTNYEGKYINIPKLIFKIATEFHFPIEDIKDLIVKECNKNPDQLSLQRTSEIFIRETEIRFVPKVNGSFVSHILLL
jgi:hypothetical protein